MNGKYFLFLVIVSLLSCQSNSEKIDLSSVHVDVRIDRFEEEFYTAKPEDLSMLRKKYPFLFPNNFTDSIAMEKIQHPQEQELFAESQKRYKDFASQKNTIEGLIKRIKYYNPNFNPPRVITLLSNIDYENRIILTDSLLLISLDAYLGREHKFYSSFPKYIKETNTKEHLIVDVANAFISKQIYGSKDRAFVAKMVTEGKKLYLLDVYLPASKAIHKIGYSQEKMDWAIANEEKIWSYFIENKLLFSTQKELNSRFLDLAPFSKFYRQTDNLSPGRIGAWMGWQIVKSFAENNDVSLQAILEKDPIELFKESNYKPRK